MDWLYNAPVPRARIVAWMAVIVVVIAIFAVSIESFPGLAFSLRGDFAPSDLTVSQSGGEVILDWAAPQRAHDAVTGYRILRSQPTLGYQRYTTLVADTGNTSTTFTDSSILPGASHVYRVRALRGRTVSEPSNDAGITPVAARSQAGSLNSVATAVTVALRRDVAWPALRPVLGDEGVAHGAQGWIPATDCVSQPMESGAAI